MMKRFLVALLVVCLLVTTIYTPQVFASYDNITPINYSDVSYQNFYRGSFVFIEFSICGTNGGNYYINIVDPSGTVVHSKTGYVTSTLNIRLIVWTIPNDAVFGHYKCKYGSTYSSRESTINFYVARPDVSEITLNIHNLQLEVNENKQLDWSFSPKDSLDYVVWSSSNEIVAIVDDYGNITGKSEGECDIICTLYGNDEIFDTCHVKVEEPIRITGINLNKTKSTLYQRKDTKNRDTLQLKLTITPSNAKNQTITWKSNKPTIAKVDKNGLVTALKKGTADITATIVDGSKTWTATCKITVDKVDKKVTGITAKPKSLTLKKGQKGSVVLTFKPTGVFNNKVKWTTSDKTVATVSSAGVITAKKKGKCTITATATDKSGKKISIKITVK